MWFCKAFVWFKKRCGGGWNLSACSPNHKSKSIMCGVQMYLLFLGLVLKNFLVYLKYILKSVSCVNDRWGKKIHILLVLERKERQSHNLQVYIWNEGSTRPSGSCSCFCIIIKQSHNSLSEPQSKPCNHSEIMIFIDYILIVIGGGRALGKIMKMGLNIVKTILFYFIFFGTTATR